MSQRAENWVFLGDSLTEGVGSSRISHVTELVSQIRDSKMTNSVELSVNELRLRRVDAHNFNNFIDFNIAGCMNVDPTQDANGLWIWNLASEGQTIETDFKWLPLLAALKPKLVVIFRGSLESIVRPAMLQDGSWPWWVPRSWRTYSAMEPRCYFSSTWWRRAKQMTIDDMKQRARRKLLRQRPGKPLMELELLAQYYAQLLDHLSKLQTRIVVLGLLPLDERRFPHSPKYFELVNTRLREIAAKGEAEFCDWASELKANGAYSEFFYRDTFHPNATGARVLAEILRTHLCNGVKR